MPEYAVPPRLVPEYMSARERTARWVNSYSPEVVYSPSYPPTPIEGYNAPPSPAVSTHSLPPKMVLRYGDGRGDVPIPNPRQGGRHHSSQSSSPLSARSHDSHPPPTPEQIRVLPSRPINNSSSTSSSNNTHSRSKSIPRNHPSPQDVPPVPHSRHAGPGGVPGAYSPWVHGGNPPHHSRHPSVGFPPQRAHYDPHMFLHPPRVGPDGMIYSHSAPPVVGGPSHYPPHPGVYPQPMHPDDRHARGRVYTPRGRPPVNPKASSDSLSDESEDTYYMVSSGEKVHVIAHSPERSDGTGSSTTKVASPYSQTSIKKPFFSRIFGLGGHKVSSVKGGSAPHGRKLHRRHSVDESQRPVHRQRHMDLE